MSRHLEIDSGRLEVLFEELNRFGALPGGGVERLAWTEAEIAARRWLVERCQQEGLRTEHDEAGNVWAWGGEQPAIVMGSHLDTVPRAGAFDGSLGVLAALEVLTAARSAHLPQARRLALVCFTDEEGVRFSTGMTGSRAVAGTLTQREVRDATASDGQRLWDVLLTCGVDPAQMSQASRQRPTIGAYLELHVEQGRQLEDRPATLGIVDAIVGLRGWHIYVRGQANHAGTTALRDRRDALLPVAVAVAHARQMMQEYPGLVATVGDAAVIEGASNIVPAAARCTLDVRSIHADQLAAATARILQATRDAAEHEHCKIETVEVKRLAPVHLAPKVIRAIEAAAVECRQDVLRLPSLAGHDAMSLAANGVSCGMIFVPSRGGLSHCPAEQSSLEDCTRGTALLGAAALRLADTLTSDAPATPT